MCECVYERERERERCVCMCVKERGRGEHVREVCGCVWVWWRGKQLLQFYGQNFTVSLHYKHSPFPISVPAAGIAFLGKNGSASNLVGFCIVTSAAF